ncbi:unnamed protein product [Urochloa humidicola]
MDHDAAAARQPPPPWAYLPDEVLGEVARHLHDTADFLRFHAACRAWRASSPSPAALHPWIVAPCGLFSYGMHFRWPFSSAEKGQGDKPLYLPHLPALRGKRFDAADAGRLLAAGIYDGDRTASLVNPLTGDATSLPPLPYKAAAHGPASWWAVIVCSSGAVLCASRTGHGSFAAILHPGKARWEEVHVSSPAGMPHRDAMDEHDRRAAAMCSAGVVLAAAVAKLPPKPSNKGDRYVLEYRGKLLCANVIEDVNPTAVSVSVHVLEAGDGNSDDDGGEKAPQWVEMERGGGRGMEHVCLFLGWESSFAVDAEGFAGGEVAGGCAYFVARHPRWTEKVEEVYGVWRYRFKDGTVTVVQELPGMFYKKSMWYTPRPRISPVPSSGSDQQQ